MKTLGMALLAGLLLASANAVEKSGVVTDRAGRKWYLSTHQDGSKTEVGISWDRAGKKEDVTIVWLSERQAIVKDLDSAIREAGAAAFSKTPGPLKRTFGRADVRLEIVDSGTRWVLIGRTRFPETEAKAIRDFLNNLDGCVGQLR
jgi:hypothetical protein